MSESKYRDKLGRKQGQTVAKPHGRHHVDSVCRYILETEAKDFNENPSVKHVYYDAYAVLFGVATAGEMLRRTRDEQDRT